MRGNRSEIVFSHAITPEGVRAAFEEHIEFEVKPEPEAYARVAEQLNQTLHPDYNLMPDLTRARWDEVQIAAHTLHQALERYLALGAPVWSPWPELKGLLDGAGLARPDPDVGGRPPLPWTPHAPMIADLVAQALKGAGHDQTSLHDSGPTADICAALVGLAFAEQPRGHQPCPGDDRRRPLVVDADAFRSAARNRHRDRTLLRRIEQLRSRIRVIP